MLNILNLAAVAKFSNRDGFAFAARTTCAADAVDVVFGFHRQAVVDHVGDGRYIQTTGSDVSSDQNLNSTITESHQTAIAQTLAQSAVQCNRTKTFLNQIIGQTITLDLRASKHNRLIDGGVAQPVVKQLALVCHVVSPHQGLRDRRVLFVRRINLNTLGLAHHTRGQLHDARCERRAEHHGLFALNGELVDFCQVVGKAEVKHAVSFVHHQKLNLVELDLHAAL